jgi:hypothetical protein
MIYSNGDCYEGEFKNNHREDGKGIMRYSNGDSYEGDFKNGKPHGIGIYSFGSGGKEKQDWKNGIFKTVLEKLEQGNQKLRFFFLYFFKSNNNQFPMLPLALNILRIIINSLIILPLIIFS